VVAAMAEEAMEVGATEVAAVAAVAMAGSAPPAGSRTCHQAGRLL